MAIEDNADWPTGIKLIRESMSGNISIGAQVGFGLELGGGKIGFGINAASVDIVKYDGQNNEFSSGDVSNGVSISAGMFSFETKQEVSENDNNTATVVTTNSIEVQPFISVNNVMTEQAYRQSNGNYEVDDSQTTNTNDVSSGSIGFDFKGIIGISLHFDFELLTQGLNEILNN